MTEPQAIVERLTEAQKRALTIPHLLIIENMQCVPAMDWPAEMVAYQWPYHDALSATGLSVRALLEGNGDG